MVVPFILAGVGMGLFFAPIANVVLSAVRPEQEGKASGATNTIREVGGVFGVAVLAAVFTANGSYNDPAAYVAGLQPAIALGAIVVGIGAIAALFIPARAGARNVARRPDGEISARAGGRTRVRLRRDRSLGATRGRTVRHDRARASSPGPVRVRFGRALDRQPRPRRRRHGPARPSLAG